MSTETELTASAHPMMENPLLERQPYSPLSQPALALQDLVDGVKSWRTWILLSYYDIKIRYLRSVLGPFWITLSMAITLYSMGYLYGNLFRTDLKIYFPYIVASMLVWTLVSTILIELTDVFTTYQGLIKEIKLPFTLHIHRVISRNFIIFFHNFFVLIPIYLFYHETAQINLSWLLAIPGLMVIYLNAFTYGLILGTLGTRFRDVSQIIKSLIQVIFFLTPIMWSPNILPESKRFLVNLNPFYALLELVRAPLLGAQPTSLNVIVAFGVSLLGIVICARLFIPCRARIIYWV